MHTCMHGRRSKANLDLNSVRNKGVRSVNLMIDEEVLGSTASAGCHQDAKLPDIFRRGGELGSRVEFYRHDFGVRGDVHKPVAV